MQTVRFSVGREVRVYGCVVSGRAMLAPTMKGVRIFGGGKLEFRVFHYDFCFMNCGL